MHRNILHAKIILYIVFATGTILGISYGMFGSIVPVFAKDDIGATYSEIAWIGTAYFVPYMFVPLLAGVFLSRYNNSYLLMTGVALNAISIFLLSIAETTAKIAAYRMITGLALSLFWPACQAIISNVGGKSDRTKNLSMFTMFYVIGFMIGPLIGNVLVENDVGHRMLFQISAVVMAAAMISVLTRVHSNVQRIDRISFGTFKQFVKYPIVLVMTSYSAIAFGAVLAIYPAFLGDSGITDGNILLLYFVFGISRVGTLALSSKLSRRADLTLIGTIFSIAIGLVISFMSDSLAEFAIAMLFLGFGFSIFFPFMLNLILSKSTQSSTGIIIGTYEAIYGIGWAVGPIMVGYTSEFYGIGNTYIIFAAIGICVGILGMIRYKSLVAKHV